MRKKHLMFVALMVIVAYSARCAARSYPGLARGASGAPLPALGDVCGGHCGSERWLVKTLSDSDRDCVSLTPVDTTVEYLTSLEPPVRDPGERRYAPVECTVYRVEAYLAGWDSVMHKERDHDDHVVLFGEVNQRVSLIAEIPNPECDGACRSGFGERFGQARAALEQGIRRPNPQDRPIRVRVTGVGFFDRPHGQTGRAPNNFELHPVLAIEFLPLTP